MIKLAQNNTTTIQYLAGSNIVASVVTDTLYVQSVRCNFADGSLYAVIARGTTDKNGVFYSNYPSVSISVNPDGSFQSEDGSWVGSLGGSVASIITQLKTTFDQFILAAGLVQGSML